MKIFVFGSGSGTEPFPGRHHTAWALETKGRVLWFDAGEGCAYTAHLMGVDLLAISDIFLSHSHMDHIGGLPHLLWTIRKLCTRKNTVPKWGDLSVYSPNAASLDGVMAMLRNAEGNYQNAYRTVVKRVKNGVLLQTDDVTVTARHTTHMPPTDEGFQSFSFVIEAEEKRIVYTGDFASLSELDGLVADGCDLLLTETGHHKPTAVCSYLKEKRIGQLCFLHHGREILQHFDTEYDRCKAILPNVIFCNDKDTWTI